MKRAITLLGLLLVLAAAPARAQSDNPVRFTMPFDFYADGTRLPAGTYAFKHIMPRVVLVRTPEGRTRVSFQTPNSVSTLAANDYARLIFRRYGDQYFLAEVWMSPDTGYGLVMSERERRLVKELRLAKRVEAKPRTVEVAALTR